MEKDDPINTTSSFAYLFKPIKDLAENWNIDLASELERYVEEMSRIVVTQGANKLNFAEAALLIQGSTKVYEKKVEYLYQLVKETLDFLTKGKQKTKGKKKGGDGDEAENDDLQNEVDEDDEAFDELHEMKLCANVVFKELDHNHNRKVRSKLMSSMPMGLIPFEEFEKTDIPLLSRVGEVLGKKDDFKVNVSAVHSKGALIMDLANAKFLDCPHESFVIPAPTPVEMVRAGTLTQTQATVRLSETGQPLLHNENPPNEHELSFDDGFEPMDDNSTFVAPAVSVNENDPQPIGDQELRESVSVTRKRQQAVPGQRPLIVDAEEIQRQEADEPNPWQTFDPFVQGKFKEKPRKIGKPFKKPNQRNNRKRRVDGEFMPAPIEYVSDQIEEHFFTHRNKYPQNSNRLPPGWQAVEDSCYNECKRREKMNRTRRQENNEADVPFRLPWGELVDQEDEASSDADDDGAEPLDDFALDDDINDDDFTVPYVPEPAVGHEAQRQELVEPNRPNSQMTYEEMVNFHLDQMASRGTTFESATDLSTRVQQWEDRIMPILKEEENRRPFAIHDYGTDVLDYLGNIGNTRLFTDMAQDKSKWEICRYFLASLMLANTENVEIGQNTDIEIDNSVNTMSLKLLKKERHHEVFGNDGQI